MDSRFDGREHLPTEQTKIDFDTGNLRIGKNNFPCFIKRFSDDFIFDSRLDFLHISAKIIALQDRNSRRQRKHLLIQPLKFRMSALIALLWFSQKSQRRRINTDQLNDIRLPLLHIFAKGFKHLVPFQIDKAELHFNASFERGRFFPDFAVDRDRVDGRFYKGIEKQNQTFLFLKLTFNDSKLVLKNAFLEFLAQELMILFRNQSQTRFAPTREGIQALRPNMPQVMTLRQRLDRKPGIRRDISPRSDDELIFIKFGRNELGLEFRSRILFPSRNDQRIFIVKNQSLCGNKSRFWFEIDFVWCPIVDFDRSNGRIADMMNVFRTDR